MNEEDKFACPECGNTDLMVVDSRQKASIVRRRKCANGHRFNTIEITQAEYLELRKQAGIAIHMPNLDVVGSAVQTLLKRLDEVDYNVKERK